MPTLLGLAVAGLCLVLGWGYPEGAPSSACSLLQPSHGSSATASLATSYSVTLSKTTYSSGDKITVTISGTGGARFEGFLVQMRKEVNDDTALGSWSTTAGQTVCNQASGVTHTNSNKKSSVVLQWTTPSSAAGNVQVWASIVQSYSSWVTIQGTVIGLATTTTSTTSTTTTTTTPTTTTTVPTTTTKALSTMSTETTTITTPSTKTTILATTKEMIPTSTSPTTMTTTRITAATVIPTMNTTLTTSTTSTTTFTKTSTAPTTTTTTATSTDITPIMSTPAQSSTTTSQSSPTTTTSTVATVTAISSTTTLTNALTTQTTTTTTPRTTIITLPTTSVTTSSNTPTTITKKPETTSSSSATSTPVCEMNESCFKSTTSCTTNCAFLVTWKTVGDEINFETSGVTDGYIAVGISKDQYMGDDNVIMCTNRGDVSHRYQAGRETPLPLDNTNLHYGLTSASSVSDKSGRVSCVFSRKIASTGTRRRRGVESAEEQTAVKALITSHVFDLSNPYYFFLARGGINSSGEPCMHQEIPAITTQKVDFTQSLLFVDGNLPVGNGGTATTSMSPLNNTSSSLSPITTNAGSTTTTGTSKYEKTFDTSSCGTTKTCFKSNPACTTDCAYLLTWQSVGNEIKFEMSGIAGGYVAVGFSKDQRMGDDNVILCTSRGDISQRYQAGRIMPELVDVAHPYYGLTAFTVGSDGVGRVSCSFSRNKTLTSGRQKRAVDLTQVFDLALSYYLFFARGDINSNGDPMQHRIAPAVSTQQVNFTSTGEVIAEAAGRPFAVAHACLMLIAWVGFASSGILMARYYKPQWAASKLCGEKVWFAIHRGVMLSVVIINIAALLLILADLGWTWTAVETTHATIGMIVISLTFIQLIMAFLRPHPDGRHRWIFNWAHWFVGTSALVLSAPAIFLGLRFPSLNLPDVVFYIMIAFVIWHVLIDAILEINQRYLNNTKQKNLPEIYSLDKLDKRDNAPSPPDNRGHCLRVVILILYLIVTITLLVAMVTLVAKYF